jgi:hypothetical protein
MVDKIIDAVLASQNPLRGVSDDAQKLERILVIDPFSYTDIVPIISHWKQHREIKTYNPKKLTDVVNTWNNTAHSLSDAFTRILLFEVASYIGGAYTKFPEDSLTRKTIPKLLHAQTELMGDTQEHNSAYETIKEAHNGIRERASLDVRGKAGGEYLFSVADVLNSCEPNTLHFLQAINVGFAGRNVRFEVQQYGEFAGKKMEDPDFAAFVKSGYIFMRPVCGYLRLTSPEYTGYAGTFLDKVARQHKMLEQSEISFNGKSPSEIF